MSREAMGVKHVSGNHHFSATKPAVPAGYKQTEAGVIPSDWGTLTLGELSTLMTNGFVGTATSHYVQDDSGVLYIQGYNVEENSFNFHGVKYVSEEFHQAHAKSCLRGGDLLTVQTGDVGLTTVVTQSLAGSNCHALIITRPNQRVAVPKFVSYYLNSSAGRARLKLIEIGTTMKHLNVGDMLRFVVPLPKSIDEQHAIATALGDVDALLEELDNLIAKKRDIKQATMQQLLTGQTRLPGFDGEWGVIRLAELGKTYGGLTGKSKNDFGVGQALYVPFTNVMGNTTINYEQLEKVRVSASESQNEVLLGDLLFNGSSETPEEVALCALVDRKIPLLYLNSFCFGFRTQEASRVNPLYLVYYMRSSLGREMVKSLAQGSTRYNLSKTALLNAPLALPSLEEQAAIVTVLADMDTEIQALEQRRNKTAALKQAMMQELLTGRTRLI